MLPWHSGEGANHATLVGIVDNTINNALRTIFKQEWDKRYHVKYGAWDDTKKSGQSLYNLESARKHAKVNFPKFQNGNTNEWDCTVLCDAILYSKALGQARPYPLVWAQVDRLRELRNEIKHTVDAKCPDDVFEDLTQKIRDALENLRLVKLVQELDKVKMERKNFLSFQVLPPHPTHEVIPRSETVQSAIDDIQILSSKNNGKLTYLYISGNPGSGKSQLARQIGERHYNNVTMNQSELTFVMTLDGKDLDTLQESYQRFSRHLNCTENVISNIVNSNESTESKIRQMMAEISTRIKSYKYWLIIVDNVEDMKTISFFLPQLNDKDWSGGQLLITTQDSHAIPSCTPFTTHVLLSKGMGEEDSRLLLATVSGTDDPVLAQVADQLDHQPLALAAAAVYFKQVIEFTPEFSWNDYLRKLNGKRQLTEELLHDNNPSYPLTMTIAVQLAVEKAIENDNILSDVFQFLSLASRESLPLEIAVNYVQLLNQDLDDEDIRVKIGKCTLILTEDQNVPSIRLHRVVHDAFRTYFSKYEGNHIKAATQSFYLFKERKDQRKVVPHLRAFHDNVTSTSPNRFSEELDYSMWQMVLYFGKVLRTYCFFSHSKKFTGEALKICKKQDNLNSLDVAACYHELGMIYNALANLNVAKQYYEKALSIYAKQLGTNHTSVAETYNNLGGLHRDLGDLQVAKQYQGKSLSIDTKQLGHGHISVKANYDNLGTVHHHLGDLQVAKQYYEKSLFINIKQLGHDHASVAANYDNLGVVHQHLGNLQVAKQYYEKSLFIKIKQLCTESSVAANYNNLGVVHQRLGNLQVAKQYYEKSLIIKIKRGHDHSSVVTDYNNLGLVHQYLGDLHVAKQYYEKALSIYTKQLGHNHTDIAGTYNNLGSVYESLGDLQAAKQCREQALAIHIEKDNRSTVTDHTSQWDGQLVSQSDSQLDSQSDSQLLESTTREKAEESFTSSASGQQRIDSWNCTLF